MCVIELLPDHWLTHNARAICPGVAEIEDTQSTAHNGADQTEPREVSRNNGDGERVLSTVSRPGPLSASETVSVANALRTQQNARETYK